MRKLLNNRNQKEFWLWALVFFLGLLFIRIDWQDYLVAPLWRHVKSVGAVFINFFQ